MKWRLLISVFFLCGTLLLLRCNIIHPQIYLFRKPNACTSVVGIKLSTARVFNVQKNVLLTMHKNVYQKRSPTLIQEKKSFKFYDQRPHKKITKKRETNWLRHTSPQLIKTLIHLNHLYWGVCIIIFKKKKNEHSVRALYSI